MPLPARIDPDSGRFRPRRLDGSGARRLLGGLALTGLLITSMVVGTVAPASAAPTTGNAAAARPAGGADLGPNTIVFTPDMPIAEIQARVDAIAAQQVPNQFGTERYALLFAPGTYGTADHPLIFQVGYYTEVAGLGLSPADVVINGHVDVYNQCYPTGDPNTTDCTALNNFWRSMSNLTIKVTGGVNGCRASAEFWAVSQAAPMRRVVVNGANVTLQDYCTAGPQYASGGFIADSKTGFVINGSQQQFLVRNSSITGWSNGVWNQVFSGVQGAPAQSFPNPPYTTLASTPLSREKAFLYLDAAGRYQVFVPAPRRDSVGPSFADGATAGTSVPLSQFYVAHPGDSARVINTALARGDNLLLTPGVYHLDRTLEVKRADTVVLGLGLATLVPDTGAVAMQVASVPGVKLAGLLFDAGSVNSPALLEVGRSSTTRLPAVARRHFSDANDPTTLSDVFFRIGGATVGRATLSLVVNSDNVLLDDIWAWRADHGNPGTVGWTVNTADTGLVVNGNDVLATGLFVEHYQKYQVLWNGERGRIIMFQNEMPYDPPNQAAWRHDGVLGYAAIKVADDVQAFEGWGMGSYCYFNVNPTIHASTAFEVPKTPGVRLHDLLTVSLNEKGVIDHVVNDQGASTLTAPGTTPVYVVSYP